MGSDVSIVVRNDFQYFIPDVIHMAFSIYSFSVFHVFQCFSVFSVSRFLVFDVFSGVYSVLINSISCVSVFGGVSVLVSVSEK